MSKTSHLAKNTILIGISRFSTQVIMFLLLPIYTSSLTVGEYGAVDLIVTYGALLAPLIMLNVQQAVFRYLIDARSDKEAQHRIITNASEIALITTIIAAVLYYIAGYFFVMPIASIMIFYFASLIISDLILQIARGLGKTKAFAITGIAQSLVTAGTSIIFIVGLHMGMYGLLLGMSIGQLLPAFVLGVYMGIHGTIKISSRDKATKREILTFSLPLISNTTAWWVYNASDRTVITIALGFAANGIYAISNKFSNIANSLSMIFYASWSETAVLAINDPDRDEFFSRVATVVVKSFTAVGILIMCATPLVFPILINNSYNEALLYIPVLILGTIFNTVVSFYSAIYIAKKMTKQVRNSSIVSAVINIIINLALVWYIGIWAAAISTALAFGIMAVYRHYDMKKYMKITFEKYLFVKLTFVFIFVVLIYYLNIYWLNLVGFVLALLFVLQINKSEVSQLRKKLGSRMFKLQS